MESNSLTVNPSKTKSLLVSPYIRKTAPLMSFTFNEKKIEPEFSLSELSDSFSFLFLYYNGHALILIDQLSQRNVTAELVTVHKLQ